jgi:hypothetical protein
LPSWGAVQRHQRDNVSFGGASHRPFYATIDNILITSPRGKGILGSKGVVTNGNLLLLKGPSPKTCFILVNKTDDDRLRWKMEGLVPRYIKMDFPHYDSMVIPCHGLIIVSNSSLLSRSRSTTRYGSLDFIRTGMPTTGMPTWCPAARHHRGLSSMIYATSPLVNFVTCGKWASSATTRIAS